MAQSPFAPPALDVRGIYQLGDTIGGAIEKRQLRDRMQSHFQDGGTDYNGLIASMQKALAAGDVDTARSLGTMARSMQPASLTPFQERSLGVQEDRLAWQKGQAPQQKVGSVIERIRDKLSRGDPLNAGEQRVYDDSLRLSTTDRLMREDELAPPTPVQTVPIPAPGAPVTTDQPVSKGPMPMPKDKGALESGQVYDLPNGRQGLWNGSAFEIL